MNLDAPSSPEELRKRWLREPLEFCKAFWPEVEFYSKQVEIIESVRDNVETYVTAGNMLGKDFVAGFLVMWYFLCHKTVRIVTTSSTQDHLDVLWAEVDRYIHTCAHPLLDKDGGPIRYTTHRLSKVIDGRLDRTSYAIGIVATTEKKGEGLAGHHAPFTLAIIDEASGVADVAYEAMQGWAKRILIIGNPNPCVNFFYRGVKNGDLEAD